LFFGQSPFDKSPFDIGQMSLQKPAVSPNARSMIPKGFFQRTPSTVLLFPPEQKQHTPATALASGQSPPEIDPDRNLVDFQ